MALKAKVRGQWRTVSKSMARVFARRGIKIVNTEAKRAALVEVGKKIDVFIASIAPPAPVDIVAEVPGLTSEALNRELAARELATMARPAIRKRVQVKPPEPELSDEELERLTAPDKE